MRVWWPMGGSSKCSAHALPWIKRKMCKGGFAWWCGEAGVMGRSNQGVCPTGENMKKPLCAHRELCMENWPPWGATCCTHGSVGTVPERERLHLVLLLLLQLLVLLRCSPRCEWSAVSCCEQG